MLDSIVYVNVSKVHRVIEVAPSKDLCNVARHINAKGGRKVVRRADRRRECAKGNISAITRDKAFQQVKKMMVGVINAIRTYRDLPWHSAPGTSTDYRYLLRG